MIDELTASECRKIVRCALSIAEKITGGQQDVTDIGDYIMDYYKDIITHKKNAATLELFWKKVFTQYVFPKLMSNSEGGGLNLFSLFKNDVLSCSTPKSSGNYKAKYTE